MSSEKVVQKLKNKRKRGEVKKLLGDDVQEKAVKITYKTAKVTAQTINEIIRHYLYSKDSEIYGEQSLKDLNKKGKQLDSISIPEQDIKGLRQNLKKNYGVDFAVKKSLENEAFDIYFKGQDISQIQTALKEYLKDLDLKPTLKENIEKATTKSKELEKEQIEKEQNLAKPVPERGLER